MPDSRIPWARGVLPALVLLVGLQTFLVSFTGWPATTGKFWGPDSYMRLARTLECRGGAACPNGLFTDSNAPFGEVFHWPFLQDRLLLLAAAPLRPVLGDVQSVLTVASLSGPVLAAAAILLAFWAATGLVRGPGLHFVGALLVLQPWAFQAFAVPRVDHHGLQGVLFLAATACILQLLKDPGRRRWAWSGGAAIGLALWVSTEALISCLPILVGAGLLWIASGGRTTAGANRRLTLGVLGILTLGLVLDGPPGEILTPLYDRFSVVHWVLFAMMALFWAGMERREPRETSGPRERFAWAVVGAVVTAGVMTLLFPRFLAGPMAEVDPWLWGVWLDHTSEFQSALGHPDLQVVALHVITPSLAIVAAAWCAFREPGGAGRGWLFLAGALLWHLGLTVFLQGRWGLYLHLLAPVPLAWLLGRGIDAVSRVRPSLARAGAQVGVVGTVLLLPFLFAVPLASADPGTGSPGSDVVSSCGVADVLPALRKIEAEEGAGTIMAPADWGPEIVFRTSHRVVGSPYHRNARGLVDTWSFMKQPEPVARSIARTREIDWVVTCAGQLWFPLVAPEAQGSFYARLSVGEPPGWLQPVAASESMSGNHRLFRIELEGLPSRASR